MGWRSQGHAIQSPTVLNDKKAFRSTTGISQATSALTTVKHCGKGRGYESNRIIIRSRGPVREQTLQPHTATAAGSNSKQQQQAAPASSPSRQPSRQPQQASPASSSSKQLQQAAPASSYTCGSSTTPPPQLATTQATLPGRDVQLGPHSRSLGCTSGCTLF